MWNSSHCITPERGLGDNSLCFLDYIRLCAPCGALYEQCGVLAAQPSSASFRIALAVRILLFPRRGKLPFSQRLIGPVWVSTTGEPTLTSRIRLHFRFIVWLWTWHTISQRELTARMQVASKFIF